MTTARTARTLLALALLAPAAAAGAEPPKADARNAREVLEAYGAAALAGKTDEAAALAVPGQSPSHKERIAELKDLLGVKELKIARAYASEKKQEAVALSDKVKI
ncbi:MAG TPA: hypothetical protein VIL46_06380 [Gemmataceae bacterium]